MRPAWMLSATQALCMSGSFLFVLLGGIIGSRLAPAPGLATLPVSLVIVGLAASVLPAGKLMRRFGRRPAFVAAPSRRPRRRDSQGSPSAPAISGCSARRTDAGRQQRDGHAVPLRGG